MRAIDRNIIEFCLYNYTALQEAIEDATCAVSEEKVGNFTSVGSPVEAQAFRDLIDVKMLYVEDEWTGKIELIPFPQKLLAATQAILDNFKGTDAGEIIRMRYRQRRKKREICDFLNITSRIYYELVEQIIAYGLATVSIYLK